MFWWIQDSFGTQNHRGDPCYESMGLYLSGDLLQDRKKLKVDKHLLEKKTWITYLPHKKCTSRNVGSHQPLQKWWSPKLIVNDDLQRCHEFPTELPYLQITHLKNHLSTGSTWASRDSVPKTIYFRGVAAVLGVHLPMLDGHGSLIVTECDRKKKQHEIKSNLFGKGESVERKNNLLAVEDNFLPFKQTNPMTTSDVSPWRTLPGFSWIGEALLGTLWSFHPDPCKNPPNMSKFHLQVFSFESLVTKLKRDDFFGGFQNFFGHHHGVDSPISPVPDGNSPLWELPSAF